MTVTTVWKKNGRVLTSSANRTVLSTLVVSNASLYLSQVVFSPLQLRTDDGAYACEVAVSANSNDFVMNTGSRSNNITLQTASTYFVLRLWRNGESTAITNNLGSKFNHMNFKNNDQFWFQSASCTFFLSRHEI